VIRWLSDPVNLSYLIGAVLLLAGAAVMLIVAFPGEKTQQQIVPQPWYSWAVVPASDVPAPPNYTRSPELDAVTAVLDFAEAQTVILEKFLAEEPEPEPDPLADTVELPVIADDTPLFYRIPGRPKQFEMESFTVGWNREQLARAIEAGRPQ
jgi:hypothetical protein